MTLSLTELAAQCGATLPEEYQDTDIHAAADIMTAIQGQVTVLSSGKYAKYLASTKASACIVAHDFKDTGQQDSLVLLRCDDPEIRFLNAVKLLHPEPDFTHEIASQAVIADTAKLGANVHVGAFSTIGEHAQIGDNCVIHPGVHIGRHVTIGKDCKIYPNVVIYDQTVIGNQVILHSGAIIGAHGFGYKYRDNQHIKVPHVGNVVIEDYVEIGANTCIDRGALGSTHIGAGSKIDNLVQLGHNNQLGRNVIICGQSGISGSCTIGDGAILAGSSGLADHVTIGQQAVVMARSGVSQDVKPGEQVFGFPARNRKVAWKELAALSKLPDLIKKFKELEERLLKLEK